MTATPHAGKDEDFQLFMALLDPDRFEGRLRDGLHEIDTTDLMRRIVKEKLLRFDGTAAISRAPRLHRRLRCPTPRPRCTTEVTEYVSEEMNRAERLEADGEGRRGIASASR